MFGGGPSDFVTNFLMFLALMWFLFFSGWVLFKLNAILELLTNIRKKIN